MTDIFNIDTPSPAQTNPIMSTIPAKIPTSVVHLEDCMEGMKRYPDNYFDLAVVDPPYGINIAKRNGSIGQKKGQGKITNYKSKDWDNSVPDEKYFNELFRVSKEQVIWGANYFTNYLPPSMGWIVWDKKQPEGVTFAMAELAYTSIKKSVKTFKCNRSEMQNCVSNNAAIGLVNAKIHPTQKPISLYSWIYKNYLLDGGKVIDTHLGSGSNRIAAHKAGNIDFVGFELDQEYYEGQEKRFEQWNSQIRMF